MRRCDRESSRTEQLDLLQTATYGVLSLFDDNNAPYGVPFSFVYDKDENCIYFHSTNEASKKTDCIKHGYDCGNYKASFCVVDGVSTLPDKFSTLYKSCIVAGDICIVDDETEKTAALNKFISKYSADYVDKGKKYVEGAKDKTIVFKMHVQSLTGKQRVE